MLPYEASFQTQGALIICGQQRPANTFMKGIHFQNETSHRKKKCTYGLMTTSKKVKFSHNRAVQAQRVLGR